jgi:hypothetical protein
MNSSSCAVAYDRTLWLPIAVALVMAAAMCPSPAAAQLAPIREASLNDALWTITDNLANAIAEHQFGKVAVLELTSNTPQGEALGADFGLLGKYCAEELQKRIFNAAAGRFRVVDRRRLAGALRDRQFTVADLGSTEALKQLDQALDGLPAIVTGSLTRRDGQSVAIECKLVQTQDGDLAALKDAVVKLSDSEWAMLGRSAMLYRGDRPTGNRGSANVVDALEKRSQGAHPLTDPRVPYRVKIVVAGQERQGVFQGNECLIPMRDGEVYEIWVENRSQRKVLMRLLVDGLNTLPERDYSSPDGSLKELSAQRVSLDVARPWVLDPARSRSNVYAVRGFVTATGRAGQLDKFVVVGAEKSLAAQQNFTESIGLITAAFYAPYEPPKFASDEGGRTVGTYFGERVAGANVGSSLGTGRGASENADLNLAQETAGDLLAVITLRYVDYDALPTDASK